MFKNNVNSKTSKISSSNGHGTTGSDSKFCGHCKKLGKSEAEYRSHWPRASVEQGSLVICPEILNTECTYCHELGHWASEKYCPALKKAAYFKQIEARNAKRTMALATTTKSVDTSFVSKFAVLMNHDSDSDSDFSVNNDNLVVDEFPPLATAVAVVVPRGMDGLSYSAAVMKPIKPKNDAFDNCSMKRIRFEDLMRQQPPPLTTVVVPKVVENFPQLKEVKKPWKNNRFVSDWNASSDEESDGDF